MSNAKDLQALKDMGEIRSKFNRELTRFNIAHGLQKTIRSSSKVNKQLALAVEDAEPGSVSGEIPLSAFTELPTPTGKEELVAAATTATLTPLKELTKLTIEALNTLVEPLEVLEKVRRGRGRFYKEQLPVYAVAYKRLSAAGGNTFNDAFTSIAEQQFEKYGLVNDKVADCLLGNMNDFFGSVAADLARQSTDFCARLEILRQFFSHGTTVEVLRLERALVHDLVLTSLHGEYQGNAMNFWTAVSSTQNTQKVEFKEVLNTLFEMTDDKTESGEEMTTLETLVLTRMVSEVSDTYKLKNVIDTIDYFSKVEDMIEQAVAERVSAALLRIVDDAWVLINFITGVLYLLQNAALVQDIALNILRDILTDTKFLRTQMEGNDAFAAELREVRKDNQLL